MRVASEIRVTWLDGRDEVRDIAAADWANLQPSGDTVAPASIVVTLDQEWLRSFRLELVDTPGINEDIGRFAIARDIAMHSDVVMLVVSADAPFSMTERAFLEEEVLARHVPAVNLVVTRLDHAEGQEREVLRAIESRARVVVPRVPVFPGPRPGKTDTAELALIRSALTAHLTGAEDDVTASTKSPRDWWTSSTASSTLPPHGCRQRTCGPRSITRGPSKL